MVATEKDLGTVPEQYLKKLLNIMNAGENDTVEDLSKPQVRPTIKNIYPIFIFMYGILVLMGISTNCGMIYHITRRKLHRDPTYAFLINIAISDLVKCVFVLPITLTVLLIENWIFGKFLCFFVPILQDIPIHISMMTYLLIAGDRYRLLTEPRRQRIPAFVCAIGTWFFAVCIVLPHPIYTTYLDLEHYQKHFHGLGLCITNLTESIEKYLRGLFLLTLIRSERKRCDNSEPSIRTVKTSDISPTNEAYEPELNVWQEKRTQKYLIFMVSTFALLMSPLMVLKLAKLSIVETYENAGLLDITFILFIWLAFLSTATTPMFYTAMQMNRLTKERLRANLTFGNRRSTAVSQEITDNQVIRSETSTTSNTYGTRSPVENFTDESIEMSRGVTPA